MSASSRQAIPAAKPVLGAREEELVLEVLRSGQLSLGPMGPRFERGFAERLGIAHASAVSSGTAGLHLALRAVGVSEGDEVVTTPFSFVASSNAIVYERATPVFADIDRRTLNLDPEAARAAVTDRTTALLPVHIFGYPADLPAFEGFGLPIVEDACEALGARHADGTAVGGRGHPAVFGFYANKQLTTGEGGMVTTGDAAVKERIDAERNQGRAPDMGWLDHDRLGFNYRLSDIASAIGVAQLERLDDMLAGRARAAGWYREALAGIEGLDLPCEDAAGDVRGWFVFVVQLPARVDRDETIVALREHGIQAKPYLPAIHLMSYYRESFGHREGEFPVCEEVAARSIALPFFPAMEQAQVEQVAEAVRAILELTPRRLTAHLRSVVMAAGARQQRLEAQRRQARVLGAVGFLVALCAPIALFHGVVETLAADFKTDVQYLSGWTPWFLLASGLMFLLPVAWSAGMDPSSRFFPRARAAYAGWGITLYLLGFLLAWQVHEIQGAATGL